MRDVRWNRRWVGASMIALAAAGACGTLDPSPDAPPVVDDAGAPVEDGAPPVTILSPYRDGGLVYPEPITWTIAATDNALLRYTTDGTDPTPSSRTSNGSLLLPNLPDGTVIKWTAGSDPTVHRFDVKIEPPPNGAAARGLGVIFQNLRFTSSSTVIATVSSDAGHTEFVSDLRVWNQFDCPGCKDYITVGIDKPSDCLAGGFPNTYYGASLGSAVFSLQVPGEAGIYPVRLGLHQVYDCDAALHESLSDVQIGLLIVTP